MKRLSLTGLGLLAAAVPALAQTAGNDAVDQMSKETSLLQMVSSAGWIILPLVLAFFGVSLDDVVTKHLPAAITGWQVGHASFAGYNRLETLGLYGLSQLVLFVLTYALVNFTALKLTLTPKAIKHRRAHQKAQEQFYARGLHLTSHHTGVMIFCALQERFVEVIADEGIYSKVDASTWQDTVNVLIKHLKDKDLTTGFEQAVAACGEALTAHFPPDAVNLNELPDVLIEI